jgi:glycosyltransferase involved in cell wall biosynthesis
VSLCVLSYNRPDFLSATLETAIANAGDNLIELIIHDDGSSDARVYDVLEKYSDRATVITNPVGHNQGQGVALNRMFSMARGDVIIKCDQDLVFQPGWLDDMWRIFDANGGEFDEPLLGLLGFCHYFADPVDMRKTVIGRHRSWNEHPLILGSAFAMPRAAWVEFGPFEEHSDAFNEDGDMQRRVTASDHYACGLPFAELANNPNMGPGPSTIVSIGDGGDVEVSTIHHGPLLLSGSGVRY